MFKRVSTYSIKVTSLRKKIEIDRRNRESVISIAINCVLEVAYYDPTNQVVNSPRHTLLAIGDMAELIHRYDIRSGDSFRADVDMRLGRIMDINKSSIRYADEDYEDDV